MEAAAQVPSEVLSTFGADGADVELLSGGRTNRTMRVRAGHELVVQQLSGRAHSDLLGVMENLVRVTSHLDWKHRTGNAAGGSTWWPELVPTAAGKPFLMDDQGDVWRAFVYRSGRIARGSLPQSSLVSAAGLFGRFTEWTADLDDPPLGDTHPGFHDLPLVQADLDAALAEADAAIASPVYTVIERFDGLSEDLGRRLHDDGLGDVPARVVHNDTKLSNVLLDEVSPDACAVLDLDLVMPGPVWHDVGDLMRSIAWHTSGPDDTGSPSVSVPVFEAALAAYVGAAPSLSDAEIVTFAAAGPRLAYELGLRYLADAVRPEPVLRVTAPGGHLARGEANLLLASEMLSAYDALRIVVDGLVERRPEHPQSPK